MRTFKVKITSGTSNSFFTVYYDVTDNSHIALIDPTLTGTTFTDPAINLTYNQLTSDTGVLVEVPDGITSLILYDQNDYCSPITSTICDTSIWAFDGQKYYREVITASTTPVGAYQIYQPPVTLLVNSISGTTVYNPDGSELLPKLHTPDVWQNISPVNTTRGPLNRCGIWTNVVSGGTMLPTTTWVGFSICLTGLTEGHGYYIGVGGDNGYRLRFEGVDIVKTTGSLTSTEPFNFWHLYPVTALGGNSILELYGYNLYSNTDSNPARFGCEIYDNTYLEIANASSLSDLNIVFSSADRVGNYFDLIRSGTNDELLQSGYSCPGGGIPDCNHNCVQKFYCYNT
jgi:hypothetical protein